MWVAEYDRASPPGERSQVEFGVKANVVPILDPQFEPDFGRTFVKLPNRVLPAAPAFGSSRQNANLTYLQECTTSFAAGFSEPVAGLMFTPDHAFVVERSDGLDLIAESAWHSRLFYNRHVRCDRDTNWEWRFATTWSVSQTIEEQVYVFHHLYGYQYFHWFMDCLPRLWLLKKYGTRLKLAIGRELGAFQAASLRFFGMDAADCLMLQPDRVIRLKRAVVPAFRFVEPLKTMRPGYDSGTWNIGWSHEYLHDLRSKALSHFACESAPNLKIYVSRADAEHRNLVNEAALVEFLLREGFIVVVPGKLSFAEQVRIFARAGVIIGAHGAGLTNLIWAPPGCTVIELAPAGLRDVGYRFSAQLCGQRFATVLCRTFDNPRGLPYSDIEVEVDAVREALYALFVEPRRNNRNAEILASFAGSEEMVHRLFQAAEEAYAGGDLEGAAKLALQHRQLRPTSYWGLFLLGKIYRDRGEPAAMEEVLRAAMATGETDRVGAIFELLFSRIGSEDFSEADLLDEALDLCTRSGQKRWYFAGLKILKALAAIFRQDLDDAESHLAAAYAYRPAVRERDFLFPWVLQALLAMPPTPERPYLRYLAAVARTSGARIAYTQQLSRLSGPVFALEIGAMDGVHFDDLRPFLVNRHWQAVLVEPTKRAYERLVENCRSLPNVRCVQLAISDKTGTAKLYSVNDQALAGGEVGSWGLGVSSLTVNHELQHLREHLVTEEVATATFDEFVERERIERIDVLQIDTEGHDFIIFKQIDLARFDIAVIHIEVINLDPRDRLRIFDKLNEHGYDFDYDGVNITATKTSAVDRLDRATTDPTP